MLSTETNSKNKTTKPIDSPKTSLSNQGYAIYKNKISEKEIEEIKQDLTIKPFSCPGYGNPEDIEPYKLYKDNSEKIYVPNFYGKHKFGKPEKIKINDPDPITISFSQDRQMREYQKDIIKTFITSAKEKGGGIISVGCGRGKCLAKGTLLPLYNGMMKKVEELREGDTLIGDDGSPRIIFSIGSGVSTMFEISTEANYNIIENKDIKILYVNNFKSYTVNKDHILTLIKENKKDDKKDDKKELIDISILDYINLSVEDKKLYKGVKIPLKKLCLNNIKEIYNSKFIYNYDIDTDTIYNHKTNIYKTLLNFQEDIININPFNSVYIGYILGLKLLYNNKNDKVKNFIECDLVDGDFVDGDLLDYNIELQNKINSIKTDDILNYIDKYKNNLHYIIDLYLGFLFCSSYTLTYPMCISIKTNINELENNLPEITYNNKIFVILEKLFEIIGISYKIINKVNRDNRDNRDIKDSKDIKIIINDDFNNYDTLPIKITSKGIGEYYGFELSGNGRFILSDRTISHNTVMGLKIAEELKVKTLILVHKEFLMNQWVERINEYLPEAKVGYIQGKVCDINRKDIVLAMIQSLSDPRKDKDYPSNLFESFGLVIADECHHLAARQFCRSLAKYPFKYTLGLSATPDRADGLQRVFKHYLGDIVYKDDEIQKTEEDIKMDHIPNSTVELYIYNNPDYKYTKEELNYQKKPNIVTMKSNIANCIKRTTFLLSFLPRLIEEGRTILILSCRRNHITDMETMINKMNIPNCSVGLYIGGMKQTDLDISATKRVIIATYDMAEEAFDCKSLNTLIYGTPHKNIKQAVGRILREEKKKRKIIPLIIDLQDVFSSFIAWNKLREKYYKTEAYPLNIFNVIDKPEMSFKPVVSFVKKDLNKPSRKNNKKSNITINNLDTLLGDADDAGGAGGAGGSGDDDDNNIQEEILDF